MALLEVVILFVGLLFAFYKYGTRTYDHWKKRGVKNVTPRFPFLGNSEGAFLKRMAPADYVKKIYDSYPGERFAGFYQFVKPVLMLRDPELIRTVMIKDFDHFTNRNALLDAEADSLFGRSLLSIKDQEWRDMRNTLSPAFTSSKMKNMFKLVDRCGEQVTGHVDEMVKKQLEDKHPDGALVTQEFKSFFTFYTNDVIATSAFGIEVDSLKNPDNEFYTMGTRVTNFSGGMLYKFLFFMVAPALFKLMKMSLFGSDVNKFFRQLVEGNIRSREENHIVRPDMIHLLMQARKGKLGNEEGETPKKHLDLSDDDITAQALLFFLAGFETASVALSFTAHELAVNPDVQQRVQEEVDRVTKEEGGVTYDGVMNQMKYLDMVVSETLRMWGPGFMSDRVVSKRYVIPAEGSSPEVVLERGDVVWIPSFGLARDPAYFPEPDRFDPERFSDARKDSINPFTNLSFGAGPRSCIGNRFALMEVKVALVHLLKKYSFKVVPETQVPLKLSKEKQGNMAAEKGFWLGLEPRNKLT